MIIVETAFLSIDRFIHPLIHPFIYPFFVLLELFAESTTEVENGTSIKLTLPVKMKAYHKEKAKPGKVVHLAIPAAQEAEAGGSL